MAQVSDHRCGGVLSGTLSKVRSEGRNGSAIPHGQFSKDFEDEVGLACDSAAARQVARQVGLAAGTVRAMDRRYLERWVKSRKKPVLRQMGVDEIYLGKTQSS